MNSPSNVCALERRSRAAREFTTRIARPGNSRRIQIIICALLAMTWPWASATAHSASGSQQPSTQAPPPVPSQSADPAQPPQKIDSPAEAARKAKEKKPATAKPKVYTEDDLSRMKGPGVSVVGETPKKGARRSQSMDPDGDGGQNQEEFWRGRARQFLDAIAETDEQIAQKKDEIKKLGNGGFDVTTGMKDNIAYINDRNGQLKSLEKRKADLAKQLDDLQEEGRKAGASPSWFR